MTAYLTCSLLNTVPSITHAFFTRKLPGSSHDYALPENRHIAMQQLGLVGSALCIVKQEHTPDVVTINAAIPTKAISADSMVTKVPGLMLGVLTADCTPVLYVDQEAGVIGASHAGWKGARTGVLENTLVAMERLGASRRRIIAAIGPCIQQRSYEIGPEFYENFLTEHQDNHQFFIPSTRAGHFMFDMPAYVVHKLNQANVGTITNLHRDTCSDEEHFFSYRRCCLRGEKYFQNGLSGIMLKE